VIFNVNDKQKEIDFNFDNRPHHFIDMESGEQVKVHPGKIREAYLSSLAHYKNQLQLKCAQYNIDLVDANIEDGYSNILKAYLIKRNKMMWGFFPPSLPLAAERVGERSKDRVSQTERVEVSR